ncbi:MAG: GspH/FimT family pseudopilin [Amphritea sp.]
MRIAGIAKPAAGLRQQGFTLIELMVTVAVLAILLALVAPNMSSYWKENRLVSATEAVYSHMQLGRSVALARNQDIFIKFGNTGGNSWCMAVSEDNSCDCTATPATNCTLTNMPVPILSGITYPNVIVATSLAADTTSIQMPRGTVSEAGEVTLSLNSGEVTEVGISVMGRVTICSDDLNQYQGC